MISTSFKGRKILFLLICFQLLLYPAFLFAEEVEESDPPEIVNGERLFLETRFAQFFAEHSNGNANFQLAQGDPVLDQTETVDGTMPGPFAGQSMNCRACHFVDAFINTNEEGEFIEGDPSNVLMKTYSDFARRSPIPDRIEDDSTHAPRNSPPLVNASLPRRFGDLFHFDAEFNSMEDLVIGTLTGRNYGWLPVEHSNALAHVAHIIRNDDGQGELAQEFGGIPYMDLLTRTDLDPEFQLPGEFLISPGASDKQIADAVAKIISAYVTDLMFSQDDEGNFNLTPYDRFLEINKLPRQPGTDESEIDYSKRLLDAIKRKEKNSQLLFVTDNQHGPFMFHEQEFRFGPSELRGLKLFFSTPEGQIEEAEGENLGVGNCITCHAAPNFTDFSFHNTGATQKEYDGIHGTGAFGQLKIPSYKERIRNKNRWLPPTPKHPNATGIFKSIPAVDKPGHTDLGVWNVFGNRDFRSPQRKIWRHLCEELRGQERTGGDSPDAPPPPRVRCRVRNLLPVAIAMFKTSGLRDLGHSAPYFHNGQEDTLEDVVKFYRDMSDLARTEQLRNGAKELKDIDLGEDEVQPLVDFMNSLNEDYE